MELYVVRHGETEYNLQNRYAGSTDIPLNEKGISQAEATAEKLAEISFDVIVTSPLIRARQTAEIIGKKHSTIPIITIGEFAERNLGVYEGLTRMEAKARYPEMWSSECTVLPNGTPDGGETIQQVDERVAAGLAIITRKYADKTVLLVCHGLISRSINKQLLNLSLEQSDKFLLGNCQVAAYSL